MAKIKVLCAAGNLQNIQCSRSSNAVSDSHNLKVTFYEFDSLQSKTGDKVSSNIENSLTLINDPPANNLHIISVDMKKIAM